MNVKLNEWNELIEYGRKICKNLFEKNGYDVRLKPYTTYDGRKGLKLQVFDNFGCFFTEYATGIGTYTEMKNSLYYNANRIVNEL